MPLRHADADHLLLSLNCMVEKKTIRPATAVYVVMSMFKASLAEGIEKVKAPGAAPRH